jgi:hypothetical protein
MMFPFDLPVEKRQRRARRCFSSLALDLAVVKVLRSLLHSFYVNCQKEPPWP